MAQIRREREVEVSNASNFEPSKDFRAKTVRIFSDLKITFRPVTFAPSMDFLAISGYPIRRVRHFSAKKSKLKKFSRIIWKHRCIGSQQEIFRMPTSMVTFEIKSVLGVLFSVQQKSKFDTNTSTLA